MQSAAAVTSGFSTARSVRVIRQSWQDAGASLAILRRELIVTLRGSRSAIMVAATCAIATYWLLSLWPPPNTDLRAIGRIPAEMLGAVSIVLLGATYISLPALAANAILGERRQQTIELLKLALIPPFWIVSAKLMNCVGFCLLLIAAVIPVIATSFYLVGIDIYQFLSIILIVVIHAFACSAAGLAVSSICKKAFSSITLSYMLVVLISGIPFVVLGEISTALGPLVSYETILLLCPANLIMALLDAGVTGTTFWAAIGIQLFLFVSFFLFTLMMVRRPERVAHADESEILDEPDQLDARRKHFPFYLIDPLRRRPDIPDGTNPMRVKELRWGMLGRETRMIRVCYVTTVIVFFTSIFLTFQVPYWVMLQFGALVMLAPAFIATAVSKEFEEENMDLMRMTLLKGPELLIGKLWAAVLSLTPFLIGIFIGGLPMLIAHVIVMDQPSIARMFVVLWFYPLFLSFVMFVLAAGLLSSVLWRRTVPATVCSYMIAAGILVTSPLVLALLRVETEESVAFGLFWTPLGFVTIYGIGAVTVTDGGRIALQCCVLISIALITLRMAEVLFVRTRMQDR
jgi:hypothetical protein